LDERSEVFSKIVSQQFDLVIATEVLEHIPNWNDAFRNLHQSLKEGGYVLLTAPFFFPLHEEPYDFFRPTPYLFEKMAVANGFSVVKIQKLGTAVDIIGTVLGADRITLINPSTIFDTFIVKALNLIQLILFSILVRFRKKLTSSSDSLYLSNLVVFRKV
jgi:SAM-dependent methyltransferase